MKIAFDVKGTLVGRNQEKVRLLFNILQDMGHEMFVWSNLFSYAIDVVEELQLNAEPIDKFTKTECEESDYMDLAIEDDMSQDYLAAKKIIYVHELPETMEEFAKKLIESTYIVKKLD